MGFFRYLQNDLVAPNLVTLTAFSVTGGASAAVQRDIGSTVGSPIFAGTYSGGTATGFEGRIRRVSDNSVVTNWTTLTGGAFGGGTFTGMKLPGVPQGSGYYRDVRCFNAPSVTSTDSTSFMIGIGIAFYGQSNMNGMIVGAVSPDTARSDTTFIDGPGTATGTGGGTTNFIPVPSADGLRKLLNLVASTTGVPCFGTNAARNGTAIDLLQKGHVNGFYTDLITRVLVMQGAEFIIWRHGESGAAGTGTTGVAYKVYANQLHSDIASDVGRTTGQIPFVSSSLAPQPTATTTYPDLTHYNTDIWDISQASLQSSPFTFSHSNMDATLSGDQLHETVTSELRSATRYARTINTILGAASGYPKPSIASAAVVDATTTTVDITHTIGTDFTPTGANAITGFEASGNGGVTWVSCTGSRTSATRITLTHASLTQSSNRKLRYQYGALCDVSGAVIDNSSLAVPLLPSAGLISPTPTSTRPVPAFQYGALVNGGTNLAQTLSNVPLGAAIAGRGVIVCVTMDGNTVPSTVVVAPNVGSSTTLTTADNTTTNIAGIYYGTLDVTAATATSCTITVNFATSAATPYVSLFTVDTTALSSFTPVAGGLGKARSNSASTLPISPSLTSSSEGFNIACCFNGNLSNTVRTLTGTETYATPVFSSGAPSAGSASHIVAWTSNTSAHTADSAVTATYDQTDTMAIVAASWR